MGSRRMLGGFANVIGYWRMLWGLGECYGVSANVYGVSANVMGPRRMLRGLDECYGLLANAMYECLYKCLRINVYSMLKN
jgi:hypothetical protein